MFPTFGSEDRMKRLYVAKIRSAFERLATIRSMEESSSFGNVDLATKEVSKLAPSVVATYLLSAKKEETGRA